MFLEAKIVAELVGGALSDGPDGFKVEHNVAGPVDLNSPTPTVKTQINKASHAAVIEKHNGGFNKPYSEALKSGEQRIADGLEKYSKFAQNSGSRPARTYLMASTHMTPVPDKARSGPRPPSMLHSRPLQTVRQTAQNIFERKDKILANLVPEKTLSLNAQTLPDDTQKKMTEESVRKGEKNNALGPVPQGKKKRIQDMPWAGLIVAPGMIMD